MHAKNIEYLLLYHCAPTLYGQKSASMFSLSGTAIAKLPYIINAYSHLTNSLGLKVTLLCSCKKSALVYVYNEQQLARILNTPNTKRFLKKYGYKNCIGVADYIEFLKKRFTESCGFPHEIGIFLDYPLSDVIGFIRNHGRNYIHCGDWKVYSNKSDAIRRFDTYRKCRNDMSEKLNRGLSADEILSSYKVS